MYVFEDNNTLKGSFSKVTIFPVSTEQSWCSDKKKIISTKWIENNQNNVDLG